jgi:hypothetical protein
LLPAFQSSPGSQNACRRRSMQADHDVRGTLHATGRKVKSRKQAIAIGLSEARAKGKKVPKKASKKRKASKKAAKKSKRKAQKRR